jgi:hypothetical protein
MEMDKTVSGILWRLSKNVIDKVNEYRKKGALIQTKTLYVKPKVENFVYKEGGASYTTSFEHVEKEEWHWKDQFDFLQDVIKKFPEYPECAAEISKKYKIAEKQAEFWLSRFIQLLAQRAVEPISEEDIVDQITTFISDLEKSPIDWKIKVWLDGIWAEEEKYELENGMVLRQPGLSDIEVEQPFDMLPVYHVPGLPEVSSSIMELAFRGRENAEAQREVDLILDTLRLFRLGSVSAARTEMSPKSFTNFGGMFFSTSRVAIHYKYKFGSGDKENFVNLMKKIEGSLPRPLDAVGDVDSISIAFQRYKDALLQSVTVESQITSVITCLEALYLKADERMELSHRLGQRVSALLRFHGFIPLEVYNDVRQAYDIRSTFIHGSQIGKEKQQSAQKLCKEIMEYARVSLLIFFQLKDLEKDKMINRLDNSLLDENAFQKAKELASNDVIITR